MTTDREPAAERPDATEQLTTLLSERILVIDGAMGTMIQGHGLDEAGYRGDRFADWESEVRGNSDLLSLSQPDIIRSIHREYLESGADIVATNTFSAQRISQADYGMEDLAYEMNRESARLAREAADAVTETDPDRPRFVAGGLGPTNRTASISPDVNDPGFRNTSSSCWSRRTPSRPPAWSTGEPICCWSRPSSTRSTPRRRSSPWRRCSRSGDVAGR